MAGHAVLLASTPLGGPSELGRPSLGWLSAWTCSRAILWCVSEAPGDALGHSHLLDRAARAESPARLTPIHIRDASDDGAVMPPSGQPSQGGPAERDQPSEQHRGWQHSTHTVLRCPGHPSQGKAVLGGGLLGLARCPPCPLPIAICAPQDPLPHHVQGFCRDETSCTEPQVLQRRTGGCPSYVPRQKAIPRRACSVQMAHQVARRLAVLRALPYPGPPSLGKPVVVVGWQGLLSAPGLQLSVPHMYHYHLTRSGLPPVAYHCQDGTWSSAQGFYLQLHPRIAIGEA